VASYELLSGGDAATAESSKVGVGGQLRAGAVDFFQINGESLRLLHHEPCAAGTVPSVPSVPSSSPPAPVFDAEWSSDAQPCLAASTADGSVLLFSGCTSLQDVSIVDVAVERGCMVSGVSWHADSLSLCCSLTRSHSTDHHNPPDSHIDVPVGPSQWLIRRLRRLPHS
jgi:hypothetical protein